MSAASCQKPGGHWPRKGEWGCAALKTPFHASPAVHKGPISSKRVSSQDPLLRKSGNFSLYSLNFRPNFSSQALKFGNFQLTSPQIWKFSVHKPPFSEASISSQASHFGNPGRTPLPEKKLSAPPGVKSWFSVKVKLLKVGMTKWPPRPPRSDITLLCRWRSPMHFQCEYSFLD